MSHDPQDPSTIADPPTFDGPATFDDLAAADDPVPNEAAKVPSIVFDPKQYRAQEGLSDTRRLTQYDKEEGVVRMVTGRKLVDRETDDTTLYCEIRVWGGKWKIHFGESRA
ncbi:hypothetical protein ACHAPJ_011700 [Fusarium lateritium]